MRRASYVALARGMVSAPSCGSLRSAVTLKRGQFPARRRQSALPRAVRAIQAGERWYALVNLGGMLRGLPTLALRIDVQAHDRAIDDEACGAKRIAQP
jgi:hypothetical protein